MGVAASTRTALQWIARDHVRLFFILTLSWTWIAGLIPVVLGIAGTTAGNLIFMLTAGPAPSCVGLILVVTTYSRQARSNYFRRFIPTWRGAWFVALYAITLLAVSAAAVTIIVGERPDYDTLEAFARNPLSVLSFVFFMYLWGPANEEFGWRGYALDPLLRRHGFVRANLILGLLWGIWHLPWIFYPVQWQSQSFDLSPLWFGAFVLSTVTASFIISIAYVLSGRNYFTAATVHAISNTILGLAYVQPSLAAQNVALTSDVVLSIAIVLVVWVIFGATFRLRLEAQLSTVLASPSGAANSATADESAHNDR